MQGPPLPAVDSGQEVEGCNGSKHNPSSFWILIINPIFSASGYTVQKLLFCVKQKDNYLNVVQYPIP